MDLVPGLFVGDHELVAPAGAGGFSVVWKARRAGTGDLVALKVPKVEALVEHLRREAELGSRIRDPQVVPILEARLDADPPHLVMPWIEGGPLTLPSVVPAPGELLPLLERALDLAQVLARLHAAGVVHGDVKPGNVLLDAQGRCRLLDLGLALAQVRTKLDRSLAESLVSQDGRSIAGTLDYMAPELFDGKPPGRAADVYALGVLLHHVATGRPPAFGVAPATLNPYLPPGLEELLRETLDQDPERRLDSARLVVARLVPLVEEEERCLARKNGHERRRVFQARMATLRRGVQGLLTTLAIVAIFSAVVFALFQVGTHDRRGANDAETALAIVAVMLAVFSSIFFSVVPVLLGMTTINAWLLRVPEKLYKNRAGHPFWSFMMQ